MKIKKRKFRLKKSVRRILYSVIGIGLGIAGSLNTYATASETNVTIEEGRISIDDYEFFKNPSIIKVVLPEQMQQLGFSTFEGCTNLSDINLPDGVCVINNRCFAKCESLRNIEIPSSVVFIGNAAFYNCTNLDNVVIPDNLNSISNNMFYNCISLSNIILPNNLSTIGQQSFYNCESLVNIEIPDSVKKIDDGAFYNCSNLSTLFIPSSVREIGTDAFKNCDNLMIIADKGSCAEGYAKSHNIKYKNNIDELVIEPTSFEETKAVDVEKALEDVPVTGIDDHYPLVISLLIISGIGLVYLRREREYILV